jgi:hypothetical protein
MLSSIDNISITFNTLPNFYILCFRQHIINVYHYVVRWFMNLANTFTLNKYDLIKRYPILIRKTINPP